MSKIIINNPTYPFEGWIKILSVGELIEFVINQGLPNHISFVRVVILLPQRLANWRWSRLLAQMLNRITTVQPCTKAQ